jgi:hypothetical protein
MDKMCCPSAKSFINREIRDRPTEDRIVQ